jgi:hypothetical protein
MRYRLVNFMLNLAQYCHMRVITMSLQGSCTAFWCPTRGMIKRFKLPTLRPRAAGGFFSSHKHQAENAVMLTLPDAKTTQLYQGAVILQCACLPWSPDGKRISKISRAAAARVADEPDVCILQPEGGHPIMCFRRGIAIRHRAAFDTEGH